MISLNKAALGLILGFFVAAPAAQAQSFLSCQGTPLTSPAGGRDFAYFYSPQNLDSLRQVVKSSFAVVSDFQEARAKDIDASLRLLVNGDANTQAFLSAYENANSEQRVRMALAFRPFLKQELPLIMITEYVNTQMDMSYFSALPQQNTEALSTEEIKKATQTLTDFLRLEMRIFEKLLVNANRGLPADHPNVLLKKSLQQTSSLQNKLLIQNQTLQIYLTGRLREFREQQRDLALMGQFQLAPLAYTTAKIHVSLADYKKAAQQIILNGDNEVRRFGEGLQVWLSDSHYLTLKTQIQSRQVDHKRVTVANALLKLDRLFEYIPAVEQTLSSKTNLCEAAEHAIAIHFRTLKSNNIRNMVLMVGILAVAPMITAPLLLTTTFAASTAFSVYSINQEQHHYQLLVEEGLTDLSNDEANTQLLSDLNEVQSSIVTQAIFLPTMLPALGLGLKSMIPLVRSKVFF